MPTTDFGWPVQRTPVFQVFGTKRKSGIDEDGSSYAEAQEQATKRSCNWTDARQSMEINHNMPNGNHISQFQHEQNQLQAAAAASPFVANQQTHHSSPWQQQVQNEQPVVNNENKNTGLAQDGYIMDLCDETYSTATAPELDEACMNMDTDFVPDPHQYQTKSSFCNDYCGSGEASPTSGRVRCFCKPSWEGMLDMRPWVSDIY